MTCSHLAPERDMPTLFPDRKDALRRAARAMDAIQEKYGKDALRKGFYLEEEKR